MNSEEKSGSFWSVDLNLEKSGCEVMEKAETEECKEAVYDDVDYCLPVDPFGMAIVALLHDFEEDFEARFGEIGNEEDEKSIVDDGLLLDFDLVLTSSQPQEGNFNICGITILDQSFKGFGNDYHQSTDVLFGCESESVDGVVCDEEKEPQGAGDDPPEGLFFVLPYLGVKDLLSVERVCKGLRDALEGTLFPWRNITIEHPLNLKLTDQVLVKLCNRAQGNLQCLNLVDCIRITDNGLKQVLESNPRLTRLSVPGCVRLTVNSILSSLRAMKSAGNLRIKRLRIGLLSGVTPKQFKELKSLLGVDDFTLQRTRKPLFYHGRNPYLSSDCDQAIDIDICPECQKPNLVYDCTAESCQDKDKGNRLCRACILCIPRCILCGRCIQDRKYEETFFLDSQCMDSCRKEPQAETASSSSSGYTIVHQEMRYQFYLCSE